MASNSAAQVNVAELRGEADDARELAASVRKTGEDRRESHRE